MYLYGSNGCREMSGILIFELFLILGFLFWNVERFQRMVDFRWFFLNLSIFLKEKYIINPPNPLFLNIYMLDCWIVGLLDCWIVGLFLILGFLFWNVERFQRMVDFRWFFLQSLDIYKKKRS